MNELDDEASKTALLNEVRAALQVVHPNVVQVLYVADQHPDLGPYVVMEYVSGGNLARFIKAQQQASSLIPLDRMREMMIDIAQGARAINERLIHRDIKPDNILIEGNILKIGDFGISKFIDESTRTKTFKGGQHIAYMAPEGWGGTANTIKIDVYSVGLLFYQIATTKHPFESFVGKSADWRVWEKAHLFEPCPDVRSVRPDVDSALAQLIQRMAAKRPQERPEWKEILQILTTPQNNPASPLAPSISKAVNAALQKQQELEKALLKEQEEQREAQKQTDIYFHSCGQLFEKFEAVVNAFNSQYQKGSIHVAKQQGIIKPIRQVTYMIPGGKSIEVEFFFPRDTGIKVRGGEITGGGLIRISNGRGANLVLLRGQPDDLYGTWVICEININAVMDPSRLIGRFGLYEGMPLPFGFQHEQDFYEQMRWAAGGMHVFTYNFVDGPQQYFVDLLEAACL